VPRPDAFTVKEIAKATGSLSAGWFTHLSSSRVQYAEVLGEAAWIY
jgi:hypothetical protein